MYIHMCVTARHHFTVTIESSAVTDAPVAVTDSGRWQCANKLSARQASTRCVCLYLYLEDTCTYFIVITEVSLEINITDIDSIGL